MARKQRAAPRSRRAKPEIPDDWQALAPAAKRALAAKIQPGFTGNTSHAHRLIGEELERRSAEVS